MTPSHLALLGVTASVLSLGAAATPLKDDALPIIRRTEFGVPHIVAGDFRGIGIGLGYAQVEDYGERVIKGLVRSKGWMGRTFGRDSMASDFAAALDQARVQETYHLLDADTRAMYDGFAEGVNIFIRSNPGRVPAWARPIFTGHDLAAMDIGNVNVANAQRMVLRRLQGAAAPRPPAEPAYSEDGSNAWALAPSRTKSGRAILLRNPHLAWTAGYWEAHVTIPGKLDFYGDFRIGSAFSVIGGFNKDLGWATTNNNPDLDEVYALDVDPAASDHYLFDGVSVPLRQITAMAEYTTLEGLKTDSRQYWTTPLGPVAHRTMDKVYIVRAGPDGEYRAGAQFLAMMRARSLGEWKAALAIRARATSNFTYADRSGNILTIWMGTVPRLPQPSGGDSVPVPARTSADIWTTLIPLDSLPQTLNPKGGYVHNENDAPHYANLNRLLDPATYPDNVERGELRLRSQHALQLIANNRKLSLEDVIRLKHSMRMLLADRVKPDLLEAVKAASPNATVAAAAAVLERWDNTAAPESRGGLLFETWWRRYSAQARDSAYAEKWSVEKLTSTPRGLGRPALAAEAFAWAVDSVLQRYGAVDVAWGEVHRVRRGNVDEPVGGCSGALGCFRVLSYEQLPDGKRVANSGDGWVLAVEFGKKAPRAFSILAYGQSADSTSANYSDQAAMFARGVFKPVWLTEGDIQKHTVRKYEPGQEQVDILIRGGTVVDGTGSAPRAGDVGIRGDRIVFVGDAATSGVTASRTIEARGAIVAPGFIDPHTHTGGDLSSPARKANLPYLMQGVTTVVTNNDGGGPIEIGRQLEGWRTNGIGTNAAVYVGQGSVRSQVMGMSAAAPSGAQLDSMRAIVRRAMDQGAIGLSTGLYYAPGSWATTEEVIELARIAARQGGIYDSHLRDESSYTIGLIGSILETIRIGREAQLPVHIAHIKALGADVWGQADTVIALIRAARAAGIEVTADQYPYTASGTSVGASLLPRWAEAGGSDSLRARVADSATRARLVRDMEGNLRRRGGAASLLMTSTRDSSILGRTLEEIAAARRIPPVEAAIQIILSGGASVASFNMNEQDIEKFMVQDFVATGSDGSDGHPRKYGTFPKLLREYVYTKQVLTLAQAVHRGSARPAQQLRIKDRGTLAPGQFADVIVFAPDVVADRSTYREPTALAVGMRYVLVNGVVTVDDGTYNGATAGRALRR